MQEETVKSLDEKSDVDFIALLKTSSIQKKYHIRTFGCQLNENDSEKIAGILEEIGFHETDEMDQANIIVFNTCTIRENANDKIFGNLGIVHKLKEKDPTLLVVLCGCMMKEKQNVDKIRQKYRFVDIVFGPSDLQKFPEMLYKKMLRPKTLFGIGEDDGISEGLPVRHKKKFRALCTIIYGCNNFCTYCIVPYVRGRERSREMDPILEELEKLGAQGYKEVLFLGQNVNSYGKDLQRGDFADLLRKAGDIRGIRRIRFMTSHPKDISEKLIDVMAEKSNIMPHLHLPLQSGSNVILKKMNRGYTVEQYEAIVQYARQSISGLTISTDIIVGFPGETEADFQETLDFMDRIKFDSAFTFQYSKREGTPAADYGEQVAPEIVTRRFERLIELQNKCSYASNQSVLDTVAEVLVEGRSEHRKEYLTGRTPGNRLVNFAFDKVTLPVEWQNESFDFEGFMARVRITGAQTFSLEGEAIELY